MSNKETTPLPELLKYLDRKHLPKDVDISFARHGQQGLDEVAEIALSNGSERVILNAIYLLFQLIRHRPMATAQVYGILKLLMSYPSIAVRSAAGTHLARLLPFRALDTHRLTQSDFNEIETLLQSIHPDSVDPESEDYIHRMLDLYAQG
jgi:hypothetical protein